MFNPGKTPASFRSFLHQGGVAGDVDRELLRDEPADVFYSALLPAALYGLDVRKIVLAKLAKNERTGGVFERMASKVSAQVAPYP